jgi:hypothetical protein
MFWEFQVSSVYSLDAYRGLPSVPKSGGPSSGCGGKPQALDTGRSDKSGKSRLGAGGSENGDGARLAERGGFAVGKAFWVKLGVGTRPIVLYLPTDTECKHHFNIASTDEEIRSTWKSK